MKRHCTLYLLALTLALSARSNVLRDEPTFGTIDFPGASSTQTWDVNSRGEIVGFYGSADNVTHDFVLRWNQFRTIDFPEATFTGATAINSESDIVGRYIAAGMFHGFVLSRGEWYVEESKENGSATGTGCFL